MSHAKENCSKSYVKFNLSSLLKCKQKLFLVQNQNFKYIHLVTCLNARQQEGYVVVCDVLRVESLNGYDAACTQAKLTEEMNKLTILKRQMLTKLKNHYVEQHRTSSVILIMSVRIINGDN